jgi:hypothetical protein
MSNLSFFGQIFFENIWGDNFILSRDNIHKNPKITQVIFVGNLGNCLAKPIFETLLNYYLKLSVALGP